MTLSWRVSTTWSMHDIAWPRGRGPRSRAAPSRHGEDPPAAASSARAWLALGSRVSQHTPMTPGPAWVPTTGPISVTIIGCVVSTPCSRVHDDVEVVGVAAADREPLERRAPPRRGSRRCSSARARVRWRPPSTTLPSRTARIGLTLSSEPTSALAPLSRPPFTRWSMRVERARRGPRGATRDSTRAGDLVDRRARRRELRGATRASSPWAAVTVRVSTTRTSMRSCTASAAMTRRTGRSPRGQRTARRPRSPSQPSSAARS